MTTSSNNDLITLGASRFREANDDEFDPLFIEPSPRWQQSVDAHEDLAHVDQPLVVDETDDVAHEGDIEDEHEDTSLEEGELVSDIEDEEEDTEEDVEQNENEVADEDIEHDEHEDGAHVPHDVEPEDVTSWLVLEETRTSVTSDDIPREDVNEQVGGARTRESHPEDANEQDPFDDYDEPEREVGFRRPGSTSSSLLTGRKVHARRWTWNIFWNGYVDISMTI